ncbi:hypothetical protein WOLCODRAFT_28966 [Wolfiporia cocos MD-104 SS10]|uniref:DUF6533 domain-containing protein n=1 Tax=Wolfiporia cocos (strain MD-104) TaxID=742152 RepID=A0A2H3J4R4_WOLCO|nr:hypothetical protein WOLCODRAFT_28966 [Wolfiporia cocos MD-104 SS10]
MSSAGAMSDSMTLSDIEFNIIGNYSLAAVATLLLYEYVITFPQEVRLVWRGRVKSATIFILNRFVMLGLAVFSVLEIMSWNTTLSCDVVNLSYDLFGLLFYVVWAAFSAQRTYAISRGNIYLAGLTLILGLVPVVTNLYVLASVAYDHTTIPVPGSCSLPSNISPAVSSSLIVVTRACLILSDILIITLTWIALYDGKKTLETCREYPLTRLLLRDGSLNFVLLLIMNISDLIIYFKETYTDATTFIVPISTILVSRTILSYREASYATTVAADTSPTWLQKTLDIEFDRSSTSSVVFAPARGRRKCDCESDTIESHVNLDLDINSCGYWDDEDCEEHWEDYEPEEGAAGIGSRSLRVADVHTIV